MDDTIVTASAHVTPQAALTHARGGAFAALRPSAAGLGSWPLILRADVGLQDFEDDEMSCVWR